MAKKTLLSQEDFNEYMEELAQKKAALEDLNSNRGDVYTSAPGKGRLGASYMALSAQADAIRADINQIQTTLADARIITRQNKGPDVVDLGDKVSILFEGEDEPETYTLVARFTHKKGDVVSVNAPLGQAIYLQKVGKVCKFEIEGREITVKIVGNESAKTSEPGDEE